jgi:lipoprotein-anchoring transpeptidase ErfK/SrfK
MHRRSVVLALMIAMPSTTFSAHGASFLRSDSLFEPWKLERPRTRDSDRTRLPATAPHNQPGTELIPSRLPEPPIATHLRRAIVDYPTNESAGTVIIDTPNTYLYLVLGNGKALRYGIGVGRDGYTWSGRERISRKAEWPNWHPPREMIERQPELPEFMPGGLQNPLGARALYLGATLYRIHGTNEPETIGRFVSSGCIRMLNNDVIDLYGRVSMGTEVVVLPNR